MNAKSIGYNGVGASRSGSEAMINKLGIADALQAEDKLLDESAPLAVAKGEVEMGLGAGERNSPGRRRAIGGAVSG